MKNLLFDYITKYVSLTEEEKEALASLDTFRTIKKGTILLEEGQRSNIGYFVLKGCLRTYYNIDGEEKTTAFYTEMEGITPNCVVSNKPSEYYIDCLEDSIITVASPDMEDDIIEKFPKFEKICRIISEEVIAKERLKLDEFKTSSPEKRYLNLVEKRPDLIQRVPQHQLASFLGVTPQSLSRLKSRLSKKK